MRISDWSSDVCSSDLLFERGVAADLEILVEDDPAFAQPLDPAIDHVFFELEAGDAIGEQPAEPIVTIVDMDLIAGRTQIFRAAQPRRPGADHADRSEEHTSELQSLMRISYAVFCLNKKNNNIYITYNIL